MSKLIVFDVDGTILDSFTLYEKVLETYSKENNLPMPCVTSIKHGYGAPHEHDFKWGVSKEEQAQHLWASFAIVDDWSRSGHPEKTPRLFDGVPDMLTHLKDLGHTLAIVTSKPEAPLLHLLEYHRVSKLFSTHRSWDDIKKRGEKEKPNPDMLQSVIRELKFSPDETVMVGDTTMDILMGRRSNAQTIGVTWGSHPKEHLEQAGAHHILEKHVSDIVHTVKKIFG